jgi:succinyl-CoA synthetase beta subunit
VVKAQIHAGGRGKGGGVKVAKSLEEVKDYSNRILGIGDALRTDLKAAQGMGIDALFIAAGIHRHEAMSDGVIDPALLATLFQANPVPAIGAMAYLAW